jgi:hypothetical protein
MHLHGFNLCGRHFPSFTKLVTAVKAYTRALAKRDPLLCYADSGDLKRALATVSGVALPDPFAHVLPPHDGYHATVLQFVRNPPDSTQAPPPPRVSPGASAAAAAAEPFSPDKPPTFASVPKHSASWNAYDELMSSLAELALANETLQRVHGRDLFEDSVLRAVLSRVYFRAGRDAAGKERLPAETLHELQDVLEEAEQRASQPKRTIDKSAVVELICSAECSLFEPSPCAESQTLQQQEQPPSDDLQLDSEHMDDAIAICGSVDTLLSGLRALSQLHSNYARAHRRAVTAHVPGTYQWSGAVGCMQNSNDFQDLLHALLRWVKHTELAAAASAPRL